MEWSKISHLNEGSDCGFFKAIAFCDGDGHGRDFSADLCSECHSVNSIRESIEEY